MLNKLNTPPKNANSREMRAYMAAILEVTGMMSGQGFPLRKFMKNLATHLNPKARFPYATLREDDDGLIYVTVNGLRFFSSRLTSQPIISGQHVSRVEVVEMIRRIVAQKPGKGWSSFVVELE